MQVGWSERQAKALRLVSGSQTGTEQVSHKEKLLRDLQQAIHDRNAQRKSAIRLVRAAIANEEIALQRELSEGELLAVLRREVKLHRESLAEFEKAGRDELAAEERAQLEVVLSYLPPPMTRDEIFTAARTAIAETGAQTLQELGAVMRLLMPRLQGRADGSEVNQIVRELLSLVTPGES